MNLLEALFLFVFANAEELYERLRTWTPAAYRAMIQRLRTFMWYSALFLIAGLAASGVFQSRAILPYVGISYLLILAAILNSARTLHGAGLLIRVDLALDIIRSLRPLSVERLGKLATLNIEWKRLQAFATLQLVGRALFHIVLFECFVLLFFWLVPIWAHPELLGPLAFLGAVYGLLSTPWGITSAFARFRPAVFLITFALGVYYAWGEVWRGAGKVVAIATGREREIDFSDPRCLVIAAVLIAFGLFWPRHRSASASASQQGGGHHG